LRSSTCGWRTVISRARKRARGCCGSCDEPEEVLDRDNIQHLDVPLETSAETNLPSESDVRSKLSSYLNNIPSEDGSVSDVEGSCAVRERRGSSSLAAHCLQLRILDSGDCNRSDFGL
jgi:hypothetical protein